MTLNISIISAFNDSLTDKSTGTIFQFGIDANGNYGYIKAGADTVTPFKTNPKLQAKTVNPASTAQTVKPDSGYDGLSQVVINAYSNVITNNTSGVADYSFSCVNGAYYIIFTMGNGGYATPGNCSIIKTIGQTGYFGNYGGAYIVKATANTITAGNSAKIFYIKL